MSERPWAFIGGGGRFIWVWKPRVGWTETHLTKASRDAWDIYEHQHSYNFMLDHLAAAHEHGIKPVDYCGFRWGRSMTPVFEDEQITMTFNKKDTER